MRSSGLVLKVEYTVVVQREGEESASAQENSMCKAVWARGWVVFKETKELRCGQVAKEETQRKQQVQYPACDRGGVHCVTSPSLHDKPIYLCCCVLSSENGNSNCFSKFPKLPAPVYYKVSILPTTP